MDKNEIVERLIPTAVQCGTNFQYKRMNLDKDEIVAEALYILCLMILDNYSMDGVVIDLENADFIKHIKSRIYRDLGTYIRPWVRSNTVKVYPLVLNDDFENTPSNMESQHQYALARSYPVEGIEEVLENIVFNQLEMQIVNCWLKGITDDDEIRNIVKINKRKIADIRNLLIDRMKNANLSTIR